MKTLGKRFIAILTILIMMVTQMPKTAEAATVTAEDLRLNKIAMTLYVGAAPYQLYLVDKNGDKIPAGELSLTWSSDNPLFASVDSDGNVHAVKAGQITTIQCDVYDNTDALIATLSANVFVKSHASSVTIKNAPENHQLKMEEKFFLTKNS